MATASPLAPPAPAATTPRAGEPATASLWLGCTPELTRFDAAGAGTNRDLRCVRPQCAGSGRLNRAAQRLERDEREEQARSVATPRRAEAQRRTPACGLRGERDPKDALAPDRRGRRSRGDLHRVRRQ